MFTWKGKSNLEMGVNVLPFTRTFKPEQRRVENYVPGRDGTYDWTDKTFSNATLSIPCVCMPDADLRKVAAWLTGSDKLIFDDEPDKYYKATIYNAADLERQIFEGIFTVVFTAFPFALSDVREARGTITQSGGSMTVNVGGTADTPCLITITNNGNTTINTIKVSHEAISNREV